MSDKKKKTKLGRFLASINFGKAADVVGKLISGNIPGAIAAISDKDNGLSEEERAYALQVMKLDIEEMESVTERWSSDMASDSWLSKNVRPMSLIFLTISTMVLIYLDSFSENIEVGEEWIELLKSLLLGVYIAYFGSRGIEKYRTISK